MTRNCLAGFFTLWAAGVAWAQAPASPAQAPTPGLVLPVVAPAPAEAVQGRWSPRPRISDGKNVSIELRAKFQGDTAKFSPVVDSDDEGFVWRRRRLGVRGELFKRVEFEVEREFGDDEEPWRDVWVNVKAHDLLEVRGGKFKAPFGLDNSTSSTTHDFIFRSLGTRLLAPGREVGGMVHGQAKGSLFTYALGAFNAPSDLKSADPAFFDDDQGAASFDRVLSGRVTVQPLDGVKSLPRAVRNLEFGVSAATSTVPRGENSIKGKSVFGYEFFDRVYVDGKRLVTGVDVALVAGPASLKAEWINSADERLGQGVGDVDLSKVFGRGWYVQGSWLVTGEKKDGTVPKHPLFQGGFGAVEVMARTERMLFGSVDSSGQPASTSPRGQNLARNHDDVITLGLAWHLNHWVKLQGNAIHESFLDAARAPIAGTATYWSYVTRLQFAF